MRQICCKHRLDFFETMHFAASVVGESGALPQVSWLGIEQGLAPEIHGKSGAAIAPES